MDSQLDLMFIEFWNSEIKVYEIQKLFKFSSETQVYKYAKKLNLYGKRDPKNPYNIKLNSEIKKLYENGESITDIAKQLKISRDNVHKRLIKLHIPRRKPYKRNILKKASKCLKSPFKNEKIIQYIKDNYPQMTINKIANHMKCDRSTIKNRIKALNL